MGTPLSPEDRSPVKSGSRPRQASTLSLRAPAAKLALAGEGANVTINNTARKPMPLFSPAKGILLTPGTAASKRKRVSFNPTKDMEPEIFQRKESVGDLQSPTQNRKRKASLDSQSNETHQTLLAQKLTALSITDGLAEPTALPDPQSPSERTNSARIRARRTVSAPPKQDSTVEATIDLDAPRSQSIQHWKSEYEDYNKRTSVEMKRILQQSQNLKDYAFHKDAEAAQKSEQLQDALSKVGKLENKTANLTRQLDAVRREVPHKEGNQVRLVSELAQQKALTLRLQNELDRVKKDTSKNERTKPGELEAIFSPTSASLQTQLAAAREASERANILAEENVRLKRKLELVLKQQEAYEERRVRKEERLKKREEKLKAAKEASDLQCAKLLASRDQLLYRLQEQMTGRLPEQQSIATHPKQKENLPPTHLDAIGRPASANPRAHANRGVADIAIWTDAPAPAALRFQESDDAKPRIAVEQDEDLLRRIQEIDEDFFMDQHEEPGLSLLEDDLASLKERASGRISSRVAETIPANLGLSIRPAQASSAQRNRQRLGRLGSRTSTMTSVRVIPLSAERAAAAKARLSQRKRSAESSMAER